MTELTPISCAVAILSVTAVAPATAGPAPATSAAWQTYVAAVEARIERDLTAARSGSSLLAVDRLPAGARARAAAGLRAGEVVVRRMPPPRGDLDADIEGGLVHHWLGAAMLRGVTVEQVVRALQDYDRHAEWFDEVLSARILARDGDRLRVFMRLSRTKVITVVYDTEYEVSYARHGPAQASGVSRSTRVQEIADAGRPGEHARADDRGFLWALNAYWRLEERPDGVLVECESLSLSRNIPTGLGWIVGPFVTSIPRESLERTLRSLRAGVAAGGR